MTPYPLEGRGGPSRLQVLWAGGCNRVAVLRNGDQIAPSMIAAIAGTRRSVDLSNYILWTGPMVRDFVDALTGAARAGVEFNVLSTPGTRPSATPS